MRGHPGHDGPTWALVEDPDVYPIGLRVLGKGVRRYKLDGYARHSTGARFYFLEGPNHSWKLDGDGVPVSGGLPDEVQRWASECAREDAEKEEGMSDGGFAVAVRWADSPDEYTETFYFDTKEARQDFLSAVRLAGHRFAQCGDIREKGEKRAKDHEHCVPGGDPCWMDPRRGACPEGAPSPETRDLEPDLCEVCGVTVNDCSTAGCAKGSKHDVVRCTFCEGEVRRADVTYHRDKPVGPCCWDERLRVTG